VAKYPHKKLFVSMGILFSRSSLTQKTAPPHSTWKHRLLRRRLDW